MMWARAASLAFLMVFRKSLVAAHYDNSEKILWRFLRTFTHFWHAWTRKKFVE